MVSGSVGKCFQLVLLAHPTITHYCQLFWQQTGKSTVNNQKVTTKTLSNKGSFCQIFFLTQPTMKMEHHHGIGKHGEFPQG